MRFFSSRPRVLVFEQGGLHVYYTLCPAADPANKPWLVVHHGICHTRRHFPHLIRYLNHFGFNVAMLEQRIKGSCFARNVVTMKRHRQAMAKAVEAVEAVINTAITGYVCHSMGAQFCEEMQQENPTLRRPTVFMAPIPVGGAGRCSWRILRRYPSDFARAVFCLSVLSLVTPSIRTKEWFFDEQTPTSVYGPASRALRHASFLAYIQLILRPLIGLRITNDGNAKRMLMCETDEIFYPPELDATMRRYPQMDVKRFPVGGHDFFIQFAQETADYVRAFFGLPTPKAEMNEPEKEGVDGARIDAAHKMPPQDHGNIGSDRPNSVKSTTDEQKR